MSTNKFWKDSLENNLRGAYNFFRPKNWSKHHNDVWEKVLLGFTEQQISLAFEEYYTIGQHMPKPAEIRSLIYKLFPKKNPAQIEHKPEEIRECNSIVHAAWVRLNQLQSGRIFAAWGKAKENNISDENAILVCNMEAKRTENPEAIHRVFWLYEVWGFDKPKNRTLDELRKVWAKPKTHDKAPDYSNIIKQAG